MSAFLLLFLLSSPARAQDADAFLGKDREALFQSYVSLIREGQHLSVEGFKRIGTTWPRELERSRRRFRAARTTEDAYYALLSLKNSYHDDHCRLEVPPALLPPRETFRLPLKFRPVRDQNGGLKFIVDQSRLPGADIGLTLKQYQGQTPAQALEVFTEWLRSNSPELREFEFAEWLTSRDLRKTPSPQPRAVELVLRDENTGRDVTARAEFESDRGAVASPTGTPEPGLRFDGDYAGWEPIFSGLNYRLYVDTGTDTLILRYFAFQYRFNTETLWNRMRLLSYKPDPVWETGPFSEDDQFEKIDVAQLGAYLDSANPEFRRLLVDIRENGGGPVPRHLTGLLANKPFKGTTAVTVFTPLLRRDKEFRTAAYPHPESTRQARLLRELGTGAERSFPHPLDCVTKKCGPEDEDGVPTGPGLKFKTFLLTGPYCVSSCDQFAAVFLDNGMAEIVGLPPRGASSPSRADKRFPLANGESFSLTLSFGITYRPNGEVLEGNPVRPSRWIYPGPDYLRRVLNSLD